MKNEGIVWRERSIRTPRGLPEFFVFHQKCSWVTAQLYLHVCHNVGFVSGALWELCHTPPSLPCTDHKSVTQHNSSLTLCWVEFGISPIAEVKAPIFSFQLHFESVSYTGSSKLLCWLGFSSYGCSHHLSLHSTLRNIHWEIFFSLRCCSIPVLPQNSSKSSQSVTALPLTPTCSFWMLK